LAIGKIVGRAAIATVAQQDDYMKRIRANGGSRSKLKPEGIVILGQYGSHASIAQALGVSVPGPGESLAIRLAPAKQQESGTAEIDGRLWRVARKEDAIASAPNLPKIKRSAKKKSA